MSEVAGYSTQIKISGAATEMTGETTTTADDTIYQITNAAKQVLDRDTAPTVLDGGVETVEDYTVNYLNGKITFATNDETRVITVTGKYLPMSVAAYANQMSRSDNCDMLDTTVFGDTHKSRMAGLKSASGTLTNFYSADEVFGTALTAGVPIVIEDRTVSTDEPNRTWALLDSSEVSAAVEGVQGQTVSWVSYDSWLRLGV